MRTHVTWTETVTYAADVSLPDTNDGEPWNTNLNDDEYRDAIENAVIDIVGDQYVTGVDEREIDTVNTISDAPSAARADDNLRALETISKRADENLQQAAVTALATQIATDAPKVATVNYIIEHEDGQPLAYATAVQDNDGHDLPEEHLHTVRGLFAAAHTKADERLANLDPDILLGTLTIADHLT